MERQAKANLTPVRQRTQYTCMSTSMMMCLQANGIDCTEDEVNKVMGAKPMQGASWEDAAACAQHYGMRATLVVPTTVGQLKEWTDRGVPVMIAWNPEGREWSHASVAFDVEERPDGMYIHVADPNIPNPTQTVRVVHENEFYGKWSEKWPKYLVRRPAMAIEREITPEGRQVLAAGGNRQLERDWKEHTQRERADRQDDAMWRKRSNELEEITISYMLMGFAVVHGEAEPALKAAPVLWEKRTQKHVRNLPPFLRSLGISDATIQKLVASAELALKHTNVSMGLVSVRDTWSRVPADSKQYLEQAAKYRTPSAAEMAEIKQQEEAPKAPAKAVVDSATEQKLQILDKLSQKVKGPDATQIQTLRQTYEAGQKPSEDDLKKIRHLLYKSGLRPDADHFRVASKHPGTINPPDGKPIYQNQIDHGYDQPLAGGTDVMKRLQDQLRIEQGHPPREQNPKLATIGEWAKLAVDEKLMDRAARMLRYASEQDVAEQLIEDGLDRQDAYLAVKAGKLLNSQRESRQGSLWGDYPGYTDTVYEDACGQNTLELSTPPVQAPVQTEQVPGVNAEGLQEPQRAEGAVDPDAADAFWWTDLAPAVVWRNKYFHDRFVMAPNEGTKHILVPSVEVGKWGGEGWQVVSQPQNPRLGAEGSDIAGGVTMETKSTPETLDQAFARLAKLAQGSDGIEAKFEKGKPADPCENLSKEQCDEFHAQKDEHKDEFKSAVARLAQLAGESGDEIEAKFEKGKPADPCENLSKEQCDEFHAQKDEHKDEFKAASCANCKGGCTCGKKARVRLTGQAELLAQWGRPVTAAAPSGLYGFTKRTQTDAEASIRKLTRRAASLARTAYQKDEGVAPFLATHSKRSKSASARILVAALKDLGPKVASQIDKAPSEDIKTAGKSAYGMYGYKAKTANLGLTACTALKEAAGMIAADLHQRRADQHQHITGFLTAHRKQARCMYAGLLGDCYPDAEMRLASVKTPNSVAAWLSWED